MIMIKVKFILNLSKIKNIYFLKQMILKNFILYILVDGRYVDELHDPTLKWKGSSNQRVIDVQKSLKNNEIVLID